MKNNKFRAPFDQKCLLCKNLSQRDRFDDTLHRPTAPQRQTTRGKTCCFATHIPNRNFDLPQPQNGPRGPQKLDFDPPVFFSFSSTTVPQMVENTLQKPKKSKNYNFGDVHFSFGDKQILETRCVKQHMHVLVDPLRDLNGF